MSIFTPKNGTLRDEKNDTRTFGYTARGQLATLTDARASVTGWSYDLAGRLLRKTYHDGTHVDKEVGAD